METILLSDGGVPILLMIILAGFLLKKTMKIIKSCRKRHKEEREDLLYAQNSEIYFRIDSLKKTIDESLDSSGTITDETARMIREYNSMVPVANERRLYDKEPYKTI